VTCCRRCFIDIVDRQSLGADHLTAPERARFSSGHRERRPFVIVIEPDAVFAQRLDGCSCCTELVELKGSEGRMDTVLIDVNAEPRIGESGYRPYQSGWIKQPSGVYGNNPTTDVQNELVNHVPRLRRYAYSLIKNRELADDLVQDTLERALKGIQLFRSGTDLCGWLCTIMHNAFANQRRTGFARALHISLDDARTADEGLLVPEQSGAFEIRDLQLALNCLPAQQREVIVMVDLEALSYADTALALNVPLGTVMSRLSRGRLRLREWLGGERPIDRT